MTRSLILISALLIVLAGGFWFFYRRQQAKARLEKAESAIEAGMWEYARNQLDLVLEERPRDARAHLMMAEALFRDETLASKQAVLDAVNHLESIPDQDPLASEARLREAHIKLFVLWRPAAAERSLRRALQLDPESVEAHHSMWKLLDLTGRSYLAADNFWNIYAQTPSPERPLRLRQWYMSQFFPETANAEVTARMDMPPLTGVDDSELKRFLYFRDADPDSPLTQALVARWYSASGNNPEHAIELLEEASESLTDEAAEPLFLITLIESYLDKQQFAKADQVYQNWPEPLREGYDYHVMSAYVLDRCRKDYAAAAEHYRRAIESDWPGPVDWRLRNRLANCYAKTGKVNKAVEQRERAQEIVALMRREVHEANRKSLRDLTDAEALGRVQQFYEELGCRREADAWREVIDYVSGADAGSDEVDVAPEESDNAAVGGAAPGVSPHNLVRFATAQCGTLAATSSPQLDTVRN